MAGPQVSTAALVAGLGRGDLRSRACGVGDPRTARAWAGETCGHERAGSETRAQRGLGQGRPAVASVRGRRPAHSAHSAVLDSESVVTTCRHYSPMQISSRIVCAKMDPLPKLRLLRVHELPAAPRSLMAVMAVSLNVSFCHFST